MKATQIFSVLHVLKASFGRFWEDDTASAAVEYALLASLTSLGAMVAMRNVGQGIARTFETISAALK